MGKQIQKISATKSRVYNVVEIDNDLSSTTAESTNLECGSAVSALVVAIAAGGNRPLSSFRIWFSESHCLFSQRLTTANGVG